MPDLDQRSEQFMRGLFDSTVQSAKGLSDYMNPGLGGKKLSDDEITAAWNDRKLTVEQEWDLWRIGRTPESLAKGERPMSPEEIGLKVFPAREKLAKSGGRIMPKDVASWVNQRAKREFVKQESEGVMHDGRGMVSGVDAAEPVEQHHRVQPERPTAAVSGAGYPAAEQSGNGAGTGGVLR